MAGAISKVALWNLGFRPFFLGAAVFAIVSMTFWMGVYVLQLPLPITRRCVPINRNLICFNLNETKHNRFILKRHAFL